MTYFIGEGEIKELTDISKQVDYQYLAPYIPIVQEKQIKPILGVDLYDELIGQLESDTLSTLNETLLPYIQRTHAYYTYARYSIRSNFTSTATGFKKKYSDQSENPTAQELSIIHKDIKNDAEFYAQELEQYLYNNIADYPLWKNNKGNVAPTFGIF